MNPKRNPLEGGWQVECQILASNRQWVIYESFPANGSVWTFRTGTAVPYPETSIYYGELTEDDDPEPSPAGYDGGVTAEFAYHPAERKLYIYRPSHTAGADMDARAADIYRVGRTPSGGTALYCLEGVNAEPGDYYLRLILKKIS